MSLCRVCNGKTVSIASFGNKPLANGFLSKPSQKEFFYHLSVVFCPQCYLVQLKQAAPAKMMFNDNYQFVSSTSQRMATHFKKVADKIAKIVSSKQNPFILEIGSNDGIMLKHLSQKGIRHLGVDPAGNVAAIAKGNNVEVLQGFFNQKMAKKILEHYGQADVIYGANVITHIEDLSSVLQGVSLLLKKDGVFIDEDPYLLDIVKKCSFDQIYDEHIYFFSGLSISRLAKQYKMQLAKMEHLDVHGGSMRYFLLNGESRKQGASIKKWLLREKRMKLHKIEGYLNFKKRISKICQELKKTLVRLKKQGHQIVGYGATAKSATLLNFAHIGPDILDYITDNTPSKIGRYSPGMHIPIKSREVFVADKPPYSLLLAWNHKKEIFAKEKEYRKKGGKFITYFPKVTIE